MRVEHLLGAFIAGLCITLSIFPAWPLAAVVIALIVAYMVMTQPGETTEPENADPVRLKRLEDDLASLKTALALKR